MLNFQKLTIAQKAAYEQLLFSVPQERGCEYSFANQYLWGRQQAAFQEGCVAFFSHFNGKSVYPYPVGTGDRRAVLERILEDASQRGIPCRLTSMLESDARELEAWFPDRFYIQPDRDSFDYVYAVEDLAWLRGKKLQKKRNHYNRFCAQHPAHRVEPLDGCNMGSVQAMVNDWYLARFRQDSASRYLLENLAMARAFRHLEELEMEGLVLLEEDRVLAVSMGSPLSEDTFDVHFEKAREDVDGAYAAINCAFARYIQEKHPQVRYLNREDDMGLEGLRKAKLSYQPHHMVEKYCAYDRRDLYAD